MKERWTKARPHAHGVWGGPARGCTVFVSRFDTLQGGEFLVQIVLKNLEEFRSCLATRSVSWIRPWMSEHG